LAAVRRDDCEARQLLVADRRGRRADPAHGSFAVEVVRVHARTGRPPLALHLEFRLVRVVADQLELLEARFETELTEGVGDQVSGARRRIATGGPRADLAGERLDQVHAGECRSGPTTSRW